jgi:hypothetical protein
MVNLEKTKRIFDLLKTSAARPAGWLVRGENRQRQAYLLTNVDRVSFLQ